MSVYVDDAFCVGSWGRWTGGGHLTADDLSELHRFAAEIGLKPEWFQVEACPVHGHGRGSALCTCHYDLTYQKRNSALRFGAIAETAHGAAVRGLKSAGLWPAQEQEAPNE